ncbi:hypothetical protein LOZ39_003114 [Ophidiomyces ophidiicola]|uniref:uncharacterized protein n=1 Tax=Ophidiomyces ophidiicola TaxID=1387563 RepID=UPI0020C2B18A|nr:uncharacterized protein LOZ57_004325 [Ophidiomyces ophidiicola]KAI1908114.1 hypothetical protein LOZ64_005645 [Ophidiomyces ophidiicola]KAI1914869.1 hypothetical protein LOZ61_002006 [Ophidiomyces ophidiicola]KAI1924803.1 hypothetical protein LOZ60_004535 [Ophidiomyces ophidiicola]KAI1945294.1 hypothetical protein LOZ57_004325 [Ophidiomyces ophidiicola]KAI1957482.1 hypothetical protein LOZ59_003935 [Ophidiomyces ophidiicola]
MPAIDLPHTDKTQIFNVYLTKSHTNMTVTLADKTPLYYVRCLTFTFGRPEMTFHVGTDRTGPVVAISNFTTFSSSSKLGLGDPVDAGQMVWEDLKKESRDHSKYRLEMTIPTDSGPERKSFLWKRTHSIGVDGSKPSMFSSLNFKFLDEKTNEVLGVFANNGVKSIKKQGKFQLNETYGKEFELMFLVSGLTIIERATRREAARSSGGGGGGGGGGG